MIQAAFSKPEFHGYILEKNLMEGIPCQGQHCANHAAETRQALVPFIWDFAVDFFKREEAPFIQLIFSQVNERVPNLLVSVSLGQLICRFTAKKGRCIAKENLCCSTNRLGRGSLNFNLFSGTRRGLT
jgi:hypothetical protein